MTSSKPPIRINDLLVEGLGQVGLVRTFSVMGDNMNPRLTLVGNRDGLINVSLVQVGNDRIHIGQYYYPDRPMVSLPSYRAWFIKYHLRPALRIHLHLDDDEMERAMAAFVLADRKLSGDMVRKTIPWTQQLRFVRTPRDGRE